MCCVIMFDSPLSEKCFIGFTGLIFKLNWYWNWNFLFLISNFQKLCLFSRNLLLWTIAFAVVFGNWKAIGYYSYWHSLWVKSNIDILHFLEVITSFFDSSAFIWLCRCLEVRVWYPFTLNYDTRYVWSPIWTLCYQARSLHMNFVIVYISQ